MEQVAHDNRERARRLSRGLGQMQRDCAGLQGPVRPRGAAGAASSSTQADVVLVLNLLQCAVSQLEIDLLKIAV